MPAKNPVAADSTVSRDVYQALLVEYGEAMTLFQKKQYAEALAKFEVLAKSVNEEPELSDRIRTYSTMCRRQLDDAPPAPTNVEERYHAAVMAMNRGRLDDARALLDGALQENPSDASVIYARACVNALAGDATSAVHDLRASIVLEPKLRFQAVNDPDFQPIREDAAFIDVIEPSLSGV